MDLHYGDFHAMKNVNLEIKANKITAFIGPSGCGKSTLLKSINRMNDLVEGCKIDGQILLDGQDIFHDIDVNLLRKRVGMVFQKPRRKRHQRASGQCRQRAFKWGFHLRLPAGSGWPIHPQPGSGPAGAEGL